MTRDRHARIDWERRQIGRFVQALFVSEINDDALLARRAFEIADRFALWKAYDNLYAALAEQQGCELWTSDQRFYNLMHGSFPWVRWVGEASP
ncbi:MAG: type II toxin-antitoxin system VapC family toxin [Dehalococcoidia bacterium]